MGTTKAKEDLVSLPGLAKAAGIPINRMSYLYKKEVVQREKKSQKFSVKKCVPLIHEHDKRLKAAGVVGRPSDVQKDKEHSLIEGIIEQAAEETGEGIDILEALLKNPRLPGHEARGIGDILKAKDALQDLKEKAGELIKKEDYWKESFKAGRYLRDSMLAIPERVSDQVAALDDPDKVQKLLVKEISKALQSIPKGKKYGFLK